MEDATRKDKEIAKAWTEKIEDQIYKDIGELKEEKK